ncbi:Imidazolonepropionase [Amycolatopsis xylanica]|uniref:Imidazolonepropionase n=1 Tax=Amycolatopsis xylanica TaxID=589385 RepID=A0A1H3QYT3_9PSEU|nr:amidohydrolase family protein [Amycolatopsis xylanica]SDZ17869.1 Imidazolonepropionase [Amycolatopsis xylanica]
MDLLIVAKQVLTGPAGDRLEQGAVLVTDGKIAAVGSEAELSAPEGVPTVHYPDSTVLPGLVNAHVHLAFDSGADPVATLRASDDETLAAGMAERARRLLDCGVTTARDLGDRGGLALRLRDRVARGEVAGPRILTAGVPLTVPGGHCWFLGGEVDGDEQIRARVRENAAAGVDVIKVMASGGQLTPGGADMWESQFDARQLRVIVAEASKAGLPVAAHAHGTEAITAAVMAGVSTIEHCTWLGQGGSYDPRPEIAEEMAARGIAACSAMSGNWRRLREAMGAERAERLFGRLRWLDELGVPLLIGTDAGLPGSVFDDLTSSLELYEHVGFSRERIIELATTGSATALGLGDTTGRVAPGFDADLLVVDGDPTTELTALRQVRLVVAGGRQHILRDSNRTVR